MIEGGFDLAHGGFDDARVTGRMLGDGVAVSSVFHELRSWAIEDFSGSSRASPTPGPRVPTRGLARTQHWPSGAIFVSRRSLLHRVQRGGELRVDLNAFLNAA